ncbi:MAG: hypothetical protein ABI587_12180 [Gemmatimonadales bacterium]
MPALVATLATPVQAQSMADQARLTIGVGLVHTSGGGVVWAVPGQPILAPTGIDTLALQRELQSGFGFLFSATYAPGRYVGFAADVLVMGLGSGDRCRIVRTAGSSFTDDLCGSLENTEYSSSTTILAGGVILKPGFRGTLQPYARLMGGFGVVQQSLIQTTGAVRTPQGLADASIYLDESGTLLSPYYGLAIGATAFAGPGWQFRWELRDSYLRLPGIAGPTTRQGLTPHTTMHGHHLFNFLVGVDIVLERKRGRRY